MTNINNKKKRMAYQGSNICYQIHKKSPKNEKPFLIFVHGFLSSQYSFRKMIPLLINKFNIITIDLPPFGDSDRVKNFDYSYVNMGDMIVQLMNKYSIHQAYLVGHSMGGQIALSCTYHHADRIKKLILLAPSSYMMKAGLFSSLLSRVPLFPLLLRLLLKRKGVYEMLRQCVSNELVITDEMITQYKKPFLDNKIYICITKMIRDREGDLDPSYLNKIKKKCVIFWGKEDEILPISIAYQMAQDLPNAELITFDKVGHLLPEEIPHVICDHIIAECI